MKVLFVDSTVIGENSPTGSTLANITSGIENCYFLQYCIDYDSRFHTPCYPTIYESKVNNLLFFVLKSLYRKRFAVKTDTGEYVANVSNQRSTIGLIAKYLLDRLPHCVSRKSLMKIREFNPDLIYALGGTITTLSVAYNLSRKLNVPIVLHVMDDWFSTKYLDCKFTRRGNEIVNRYAQKVLSQSINNLGISKKMAKHYSCTFDKPFSYAMNCIDAIYDVPYPCNPKLRYVFSGGIHGGREESLFLLGSIIKNDKVLSERISFEIFTSKICIDRFGDKLSSVAKVFEYVPDGEMFSNMANADVLVHVESFLDDQIEYFRYSLSTKIPEYMSVGRAILCFGPRDIGTVSYLYESHIGVVASNEHELKKAIIDLTINPEFRVQLGKKAQKVATEEHLRCVVSARVQNVFESSICRRKINE